MQKLTLLLSLLVLFAACQKEEEKEDQEIVVKKEFPATEAEMQTIIQHGWKNSSFNLEGVGNQECRNDDQFTFNDNGTYIYDSGTQLCGGDDVITKTGTWEASYSAKTITFDKGTADEYSADIVSLTSTEMEVLGNWVGLDITATYKVQ